MAGVAIHTPFLDAHPEYSGTLSGRVGLNSRMVVDNGEFVRLYAYSDDSIAWSSSEASVADLTSTIQIIRFRHRQRRRLRWVLQYTRVHNGQIYTSNTPVDPPSYRTERSGYITAGFNGATGQYPQAIRDARRRASMGVQPQRSRVRHPINAPLRPSPETISRPFLAVNELCIGTGNPYQTTLQTKSYARYSRTWTGVRTPGFSRLRPSQYPVNPHSVMITEVPTNYLIEVGYGLFGGWSGYASVIIDAYTFHYTAPAAFDSHLPLARNTAIRRLIDQAELGIDANLAQDFAQIGQTTRLLGDNAKKIAKSFRALRRGNIPEAIDTLFAGRRRRFRRGGGPDYTMDLANQWLELQYGWKPLLQDIHGAFQAMSNLAVARQGFVARVAASGTATSRTRSTFTPWDTSINAVGETVISQTSRCKMTLRFRIASPLQSFLHQTGFANPINLGWEILPFSFVVDWFLPIGPFLETLTAWNGLEFIDGSQTLFTKRRTTSGISGGNTVPATGNAKWVQTYANYERLETKLDRTKLTSFPSLTFPSFRDGLASVDHAANAIALLKSVFHR
jgi:hypothetical protein